MWKGGTRLGEAYIHKGPAALYPSDRFREMLGRALELDPSFAPAYIHLVQDAFHRHDSLGAKELIGRSRRLDPSSEDASAFDLAYALAWGDSLSRELSAAVVDTAGAELLSIALFALLFSPDLWEQTIKVAQDLSEQRHPSLYRAEARSLMAAAYLVRGRLQQARTARKAWAAIAVAA